MTDEMTTLLRFLAYTALSFSAVVALHGFLPPLAVLAIVVLLGVCLVILGTTKNELVAYLVPLGSAVLALVLGWG